MFRKRPTYSINYITIKWDDLRAIHVWSPTLSTLPGEQFVLAGDENESQKQ